MMSDVDAWCFLIEATAMPQSCWDATVGMHLSQGMLQQAMRSHVGSVQYRLTYSRCSARSTILSAAHVRSAFNSLSGLPLHACAEQSSCLSRHFVAMLTHCLSAGVYAHSAFGGFTHLACHVFVCLDQLG